MNGQYAEIKAELEQTKAELLKRIEKANANESEMSDEFLFSKIFESKQKIVMRHIKDDLLDVERALSKFEIGLFGKCEVTGKQIPIEQLKILPTARSINDFTFSEIYERYGQPLEKIPHISP